MLEGFKYEAINPLDPILFKGLIYQFKRTKRKSLLDFFRLFALLVGRARLAAPKLRFRTRDHLINNMKCVSKFMQANLKSSN